MKRRLLAALVAGVSLLSVTTEASADGVYLGVGGGIQHSQDWAAQLGVPVHGGFEAHYSHWQDVGADDRHVGALGLGYRWALPASFSFVFGGAYINRVTDNLLRHMNAYFELRWRPLEALSCQVGHYSSVGDDTGENMVLCGVHWRLSR